MKVVFLDRDNTINIDPGYISSPDQFELFADSGEALRLLQLNGYKLIILTNQSGIGRGYFSVDQLEKVHKKFRQLLSNASVTLTDIFYCPHEPQNNCQCRKPRPGLIEQALDKYPNINLSESFIVGDKLSDIGLAEHFPIHPILVRNQDATKQNPDIPYFDDLKQAAEFILQSSFEKSWSKNLFSSHEDPDLHALRNQDRLQHKKLVFTNGCFDILHPGHMQYLSQAKSLGDKLVVGLNSDESVKQLKGPERPINSEYDRALMLLQTEAVDQVIIFAEQTPELLIEKLQPDIHVKGGDYTVEDLPEAAVVNRYGGSIVILPFRKGYSTTKLIERLN